VKWQDAEIVPNQTQISHAKRQFDGTNCAECHRALAGDPLKMPLVHFRFDIQPAN
jgi:mono/diheme cytochrome c family protein